MRKDPGCPACGATGRRIRCSAGNKEWEIFYHVDKVRRNFCQIVGSEREVSHEKESSADGRD